MVVEEEDDDNEGTVIVPMALVLTLNLGVMVVWLGMTSMMDDVTGVVLPLLLLLPLPLPLPPAPPLEFIL